MLNPQCPNKTKFKTVLTKNFYDFSPQITCDTEAESSTLLHYPPNNGLLAKHTLPSVRLSPGSKVDHTEIY